MDLSEQDRNLLEALAPGLPLDPRPYARLGEKLGLGEDQVIAALRRLVETGIVKRFGVIVNHRRLGYRANAMTVWDVPDDLVAEAGRRLAALPFITLCYRRPRAAGWPYNLFCMIHGRSRAAVEALIEQATHAAGLSVAPRAILFSRRCFRQRGARYGRRPAIESLPPEAIDGRP
jgi:DNA-binding Lrp family transcriptional regulator